MYFTDHIYISSLDFTLLTFCHVHILRRYFFSIPHFIGIDSRSTLEQLFTLFAIIYMRRVYSLLGPHLYTLFIAYLILLIIIYYLYIYISANWHTWITDHWTHYLFQHTCQYAF